jgi:hypothetical protein
MARGGSIFSNFHFGVFGVNECKSSDEGWYCQLSRFFSALMMILFIGFIIVFIFQFLKRSFSGGSSIKGSRTRSRSK